MVASVLVQEGNDGFNVGLLNDVKRFWTLDEDTMKYFQNACEEFHYYYHHIAVNTRKDKALLQSDSRTLYKQIAIDFTMNIIYIQL